MVTPLQLFTKKNKVVMAKQLLKSGRDINYDFAQLTDEEKRCFERRELYEDTLAKCFLLLKDSDQAWVVDNINVDLFETLEQMEENL